MTSGAHFPCPGCGAELVYEPGTTQMSCPYCGGRVDIPKSDATVDELPYREFLRREPSQLAQIAEGALEVPCARCGAVVEFVPPEVAGECAFCGAQLVAQPKAADPMVAPEGLLPFGFPAEKASAEIKGWLASRWFAPNALKKVARPQSISGVYLPFWTYDARTVSDYRGERGEHYYVTETYTETDENGRQVTKTRQVQHTRWYPASGRVVVDFDDVLIPASKNLSTSFLNRLEPWDLPSVVPYEPAYLSGFKAQRYQVSLEEGFELAKHVMAGQIATAVRRDIGGDEQRIHNVSTEYPGITFKHLLLPVYLAAYHFKAKLFQVMVNARTGEVTGDRPYSVAKIVALVLTILLIVVVLFALYHK